MLSVFLIIPNFMLVNRRINDIIGGGFNCKLICADMDKTSRSRIERKKYESK